LVHELEFSAAERRVLGLYLTSHTVEKYQYKEHRKHRNSTEDTEKEKEFFEFFCEFCVSSVLSALRVSDLTEVQASIQKKK
jgi:hypothetical protein